MRLLQGFIGIVSVLIVQNISGAISVRQALCQMEVEQWSEDLDEIELKTCFPYSNEIISGRFAIASQKDTLVEGFKIRDIENVTFLPDNIAEVFPELVAFQVYNCSVPMVEENTFKGLQKLRFLDLSHNKIAYMNRNAFSDLESLEYLGITFNRIHHFGQTAFETLRNLKRLLLHDNVIHYLNPNVFNSLVNVEYINLDNNELQSLDENIFENLTNLKNVSFAGNKLQEIPKKLFHTNSKLEHIWLDSNNVCVEKFYRSNNFVPMKSDLNQNCTGTKTEITFTPLLNCSTVDLTFSSSFLMLLSSFTSLIIFDTYFKTN